MASVNVETTNTKWGLTHMVTGPRTAVKNWCKRMENSSRGRVLVRPDSVGRKDQVTYRVDVDNYKSQPAAVQQESDGPGLLTCVAIGLGIGWLFGG